MSVRGRVPTAIMESNPSEPAVARTDPADPVAVRVGERLLTTDKLVKAYRGRRVVNGVSIHVDAGEIVGLLGPNGAGKTTTFNLVVGLVRPDGGSVNFRGRPMTGLPMHRRARLGIGYLTQEPSVFRKLTVEQNLLAILETCRLGAEERRMRLKYLLDGSVRRVGCRWA